MARSIVVGLYPDAISDSAVAAADAFLADPSVPPALRRLVSEGRDDVQRALRARQRELTVYHQM
jgi:aminopeptidase N